MKLRSLGLGMMMAVGVMALAGCGGGGGSSPAPAPTSVVSGVASKGLISNGIVKIFAVGSDGAKGEQKGTGTTDANGNYSVNLGSYTGPVLVELSGGANTTYKDEATGATVTVANGTTFLRAALANVDVGTPVTVAITPLTELAVTRATTNGKTPATAITAANQVVADLFGITDIVAVRPVAPTSTALNATGVTSDQKTYTLALAAVSQMATTASAAAIVTAIATLNSGIDPVTNIMSTTTVASFNTALTDYLAPTNTNNTTGVAATDPVVTAITANVGVRTATITLSGAGIAAGGVYAVDTVISLPSTGFVVAYDQATGLVDSSKYASLNGSGTVRYDSATHTLVVAVAKNSVLADGALLSVALEVDAGFAATAVVVSGSPVYKDSNGANITVNGATLSVAVQ